jgi:hypothetical protein
MLLATLQLGFIAILALIRSWVQPAPSQGAPREPGTAKSRRDHVHEFQDVLGPTVQGESQTPQRDRRGSNLSISIFLSTGSASKRESSSWTRPGRILSSLQCPRRRSYVGHTYVTITMALLPIDLILCTIVLEVYIQQFFLLDTGVLVLLARHEHPHSHHVRGRKLDPPTLDSRSSRHCRSRRPITL